MAAAENSPTSPSRARHHTTIHVVADDHDQALADLTYYWSNEDHQRWVTTDHDIDTPNTGTEAETDPLDAALAQIADITRTLDRLDSLQQPTHEPPDLGHEPPTPHTDIGM